MRKHIDHTSFIGQVWSNYSFSYEAKLDNNRHPYLQYEILHLKSQYHYKFSILTTFPHLQRIAGRPCLRVVNDDVGFEIAALWRISEKRAMWRLPVVYKKVKAIKKAMFSRLIWYIFEENWSILTEGTGNRKQKE